MPAVPGDPKATMRAEMRKYKAGALHSGAKTGPIVTNPKQAVAIGLSQARKAKKVPRAFKPRGKPRRTL